MNNTYEIAYKDKTTKRKASCSTDAITKLCDQYGWNWNLKMVDANTRGDEWCEGIVDRDGGINYTMRIFANKL